MVSDLFNGFRIVLIPSYRSDSSLTQPYKTHLEGEDLPPYIYIYCILILFLVYIGLGFYPILHNYLLVRIFFYILYESKLNFLILKIVDMIFLLY